MKMKFDFKNILIGVIVGILGAILVECLLNDLYIDIRVGDFKETYNKTNLIE